MMDTPIEENVLEEGIGKASLDPRVIDSNS